METIMWIARDKDGSLFMFQNKPYREGEIWYSRDNDLFPLSRKLFSIVKWEDPEPAKVQVEIIK